LILQGLRVNYPPNPLSRVSMALFEDGEEWGFVGKGNQEWDPIVRNRINAPIYGFGIISPVSGLKYPPSTLGRKTPVLGLVTPPIAPG
jgi:hypothetical protein